MTEKLQARSQERLLLENASRFPRVVFSRLMNAGVRPIDARQRKFGQKTPYPLSFRFE